MVSKKEFHIWEGIYKNFKEAHAVGKGHEGNAWFNKSLTHAKELLQMSKGHSFIPKVTGYRESLLPFLIAAVYAKKNKAKIIDFGGSLGFTFLPSLFGLPSCQNLKYYLVDVDQICREGKVLFKKFSQITFGTTLPSKKVTKQVDIIHLGSSLQYVDDWKSLLRQLSSFKPEYILLTDFYAGDVPTFATLQTYYDSKIPFWFFNLQTVLDEFSKLNYEPVFKGTHRGTILGVEQGPPQNNFPKQYRLGDTCDLLLVRGKK